MAYSSAAGIVPLAPGYSRVGIAPMVQPASGPGGLSASVNTVQGPVAVTWRRATVSPSVATVSLAVMLPVGVRAEVRVPSVGLKTSTLQIFETGTKVWDGAQGGYQPGVAGIQGADATVDGVVFKVVAGTYDFATRSG